jgi:hypothetical protein
MEHAEDLIIKKKDKKKAISCLIVYNHVICNKTFNDYEERKALLDNIPFPPPPPAKRGTH